MLKTSPDFFYSKKIDSIHMESKKHQKTLSVETAIDTGSDLIIKFKDINTTTDAYRLIGYSAYLEDQEEIKAFKKDNLVDYQVIEKSGDHWGIVTDDLEAGLTHTLEIDDHGDIILLPCSDSIIKEINKEKKTIIIDPPEGLRNLNK